MLSRVNTITLDHSGHCNTLVCLIILTMNHILVRTHGPLCDGEASDSPQSLLVNASLTASGSVQPHQSFVLLVWSSTRSTIINHSYHHSLLYSFVFRPAVPVSLVHQLCSSIVPPLSAFNASAFNNMRREALCFPVVLVVRQLSFR